MQLWVQMVLGKSTFSKVLAGHPAYSVLVVIFYLKVLVF
jgi:Fe-S cluster assembly ATPase SufC